MNVLKRIFAISLVFVMAFSVAGCHKKNEVAVTVGDIEFTSAYYACALVYADTEARGKVEEGLDEDESKTDIDYYSHKVEDTEYVEWVQNKAIETLKQIAAYKTKCNEAELELDEETANYADQYSSYYWSNYGYSQVFEPNGVSQDTYKQYMKDSYYSNLYFEHLYGEDGEKAIASDEVKSTTLENFILVDKIDVSFSSKEEAEITELKSKIEGYKAALEAGTTTFEQVYKEYNNKTEEEADTSEDTEELKPLDKYASIIGTKDTSYAVDYFDTVKAMANGEIKIVELEENAGIVLVIKQELSADEYYVKNLDIAARHLIADEEYNEFMKDFADSLDKDINKYATKQFKVKKIVYPQTSAN